MKFSWNKQCSTKLTFVRHIWIFATPRALLAGNAASGCRMFRNNQSDWLLPHEEEYRIPSPSQQYQFHHRGENKFITVIPGLSWQNLISCGKCKFNTGKTKCSRYHQHNGRRNQMDLSHWSVLEICVRNKPSPTPLSHPSKIWERLIGFENCQKAKNLTSNKSPKLWLECKKRLIISHHTSHTCHVFPA